MCQDCRVQGLRRKRLQFEEPRETGRPLTQRRTYPSRSRKVWRDRYEAARKSLLQDIASYQRRWEEGRPTDFLTRAIRRGDWTAQKYRRTRAEAKAHEAI